MDYRSTFSNAQQEDLKSRGNTSTDTPTQKISMTCGSKRKSGIKNRKPSRSSKPIQREYTEYVYDIEKLPHFRPLPADAFTDSFVQKLNYYNYPLPKMLEGGMRLLFGFEEEFAEDIGNDLPKAVIDASQCVVSLASFDGILIGCHESTTRVLTSASLVTTSDTNDIAGNLEIQVYLQDNQNTIGTLHWYNLEYNIAVVSFANLHCDESAKFNNEVQIKPHRDVVVAIGSIWKTGKLMATRGVVTRRKTKLDCEELKISTCKITKAGIGGPLIDLNGNFIGMNFYDKEQTPYLPSNIILRLLSQYDAEGLARLFPYFLPVAHCNVERVIANPGTVVDDVIAHEIMKDDVIADEVIDSTERNRWPLPKPCWHHPSSVVREYKSYKRKH